MRHSLRVLLLTLALVLIGLALTPNASPSFAAEASADTVGPPGLQPALPYVTGVQIGPVSCDSCPPVVCPNRPIPLRIAGAFPSGCLRLAGFELVPSPLTVIGPPIARLIIEDRSACGPCPMVALAWVKDTMLAGLPPGSYRMPVEVVLRTFGPDSASCDSILVTNHGQAFAFTVRDSCPVPVPGPLPYTDVIRIGAPCFQTMRDITGDCPTCPNESIPFFAAGTFPSNCYQFRGIQVLDLSESPIPRPPIVRIVVAVNDCLEWPCSRGAVPWEGHAVLPPLPPGSYQLPVELALVSMCDSSRVDSLYSTLRAFTVRDSCGGTTPPCLFVDWDHFGRVGGCDAHVGPGEPATVRMILATPVPLAGLQGKLSLWPPGLRITGLEPIGPAAGMKLAWRPDTSGATFVMFAESGAPIVPVRCDSNARCLPPAVLAVRVEAPPSAPAIAPVTHLAVRMVLGSDSLGGAVIECPIMTLAVVQADICSGAVSCDFNRDGQLDVRDLVTMVHCILGTGPCPDTVRAGLDCNADGRLGVDDVLCCARSILRGGVRDTTGGRSEPGVSVALGEPQWRSDGLGVPVALDGADRVGAARLALALPLDRYEVTGVDLGDAASQWLEVHEVVDGRLVLGLIGLAPAGAAASRLPLSITLALKPGQDAGGDLTLADAQFSGPDGVTLVTPQTQPVVPLPSPGALRLAAPRPNPFTGETRFSLALARAADVEVTVHDLSGRRVATLQRGPLGAGPHEYAWTGARDDGSVAPDGIYFVHARVGAERLARKVVFLRGH